MANEIILKHYDEFKSVLDNYKVALSSQQNLKQLNLLLLVAPTASGRNTIINELIKTGNYYYIVSDTTRPPKIRDGEMEQNGVQYFYRTEEEILHDLRNGKFLEAAIIHNQQVSGISMRELDRALVMEKTAVTDIEIKGVETIKKLKPDAISVFVVPPSFDEWQRRFKARENITTDELKNRLQSALNELKIALGNTDYIFVINDKLNDAVININQIAHYGIRDESSEKEARLIAEQLYIATKAYLE